MNKRLHQLANDARVEVSQRIGYNDRDREVAFEEKFAELIVLECAGLCVSNIADEICGGQGFSDKIKQHFGVE